MQVQSRKLKVIGALAAFVIMFGMSSTAASASSKETKKSQKGSVATAQAPAKDEVRRDSATFKWNDTASAKQVDSSSDSGKNSSKKGKHKKCVYGSKVVKDCGHHHGHHNGHGHHGNHGNHNGHHHGQPAGSKCNPHKNHGYGKDCCMTKATAKKHGYGKYCSKSKVKGYKA